MPEYIPYLLQYRYQVGDKQAFRQTTSMLMNDPVQGELGGRVVHDIDYECIADSPHGGWEIHMVRRLVEKSGALAESIPESELHDKRLTYRILPDGTPFDLGQGLPPRKPAFPHEGMGLGASWNNPETVSRNGLPPLTVTYQMVVVEERQGDLQTDLVAMAQTEQPSPEGPIQVEVMGTVTFAINRGKIVRSVTNFEMTWPSSTPPTERPVRRKNKMSIQLEPR